MKKTLLSCCLATMLPLASAHADISFNGFANIVAGKTSSNDNLWGYDDNIDFKQDSLFALQASTDLSEGLTATVQIISRGSENWDTEFEWAYLNYQLNESTNILVGRQRAPLYMYSDYLDVSYAYPWITPPEGVYDLELTKYDGISISHTFNIAGFDATAQALYGSEDDTLAITDVVVNAQFDSIHGATLTLNRDWLTLRSAYISADLTLPLAEFNALANAWRNIEGFAPVADELLIDDDNATFIEYGFQIDYNNFLLIGEYTHIDYDGMPIDTEESMFITAGYRFDDVLVHLTYGGDDNDVDRLGATLPDGVSAELDQLNSLTRQGLAFRDQNFTYLTLGARWDFHDSAALKVEFTRHDNDLLDQDTSLVRTALVTVF